MNKQSMHKPIAHEPITNKPIAQEPILDAQEKNASIEFILAQGLVRPQSAWERVVEMTRALGLRCIFWDMGYSIIFSAVTLAAVLAVLITAPGMYRFATAVGAAPLLFLVITLFAETTEIIDRLYELKQTCRYTIRQITAVRVLFYSLAGMVFTAGIVLFSTYGIAEFVSLLLVCLTALFLCAALGLSVLRFVRVKWAYALYAAFWVFASLALPALLGAQWEAMLRQTPLALSGLMAIAGAGILVYQLSRMLSEVKRYAVAL